MPRDGHVQFGKRSEETDWSKGRNRASDRLHLEGGTLCGILCSAYTHATATMRNQRSPYRTRYLRISWPVLRPCKQSKGCSNVARRPIRKTLCVTDGRDCGE